MMKAVVIIPARWDSTRFPGKPLHHIAGKPLLRHVWERCLRARNIDQIIIATDDARIGEAASAWGAQVSLTSAKHRSGSDRVAEVARRVREFPHIINVQGDEPLVDPRLVERMVNKLRANPKIGMVTAAHPFGDPAEAIRPHQVKVVTDRRSNALYFSRAPIPFQRGSACRFLRHQGIYGFRRETLLQFVRWKPSPLECAESLEQLRALENGVTVHVLVTEHGAPGVDTPEDAITLERILARETEEARSRAREIRPQ